MQRSYLYAPGHNALLVEKVFKARADAVILDLEDAVPSHLKAEARQIVAAKLREKPAWVRINKPGTEECARDLDAIARHVVGLRIPKAETPESIRWVAERSPHVPLGCVIETARGAFAALEIAQVPGVLHLTFGAADFALDIGSVHGRESTLLVRSLLVIASRRAGIDPPVDTAYTYLHDYIGLRKEAEFARDLGFFGKSAIHPTQLETIHDVFTPTELQFAHARAIVKAFADAEGGPCQLSDGEFVDAPIAERARRLVNLAAGVRR